MEYGQALMSLKMRAKRSSPDGISRTHLGLSPEATRPAISERYRYSWAGSKGMLMKTSVAERGCSRGTPSTMRGSPRRSTRTSSARGFGGTRSMLGGPAAIANHVLHEDFDILRGRFRNAVLPGSRRHGKRRARVFRNDKRLGSHTGMITRE